MCRVPRITAIFDRWLLRRFDFFCKAFDFDPTRTTIPIANEFVTRDLFTTVLRFVYAGEVPGAEDFDSSDGLCQLFRVADFFQVFLINIDWSGVFVVMLNSDRGRWMC